MELNFNSVETIAQLNASAAFQVDSGKVFKDDVDICPVRIDKRLAYIPWGGDNMLPYNILDLIESDETLSTCQQFNAEVCYGSGLRYNVDKCSKEVRSQVDEFMMDNAIAQYWLGVCQDFKHFAFTVSVVILNSDGTRIVRLLRKEACYCRLSPAENDGSIKYLLYANWRKVIASREEIEVIELLDINSPWRDLAIRMGRETGDDGKKKYERKPFYPFVWVMKEALDIMYNTNKKAFLEGLSKYGLKVVPLKTTMNGTTPHQRLANGYTSMITATKPMWTVPL